MLTVGSAIVEVSEFSPSTPPDAERLPEGRSQGPALASRLSIPILLPCSVVRSLVSLGSSLCWEHQSEFILNSEV